jgi:hypothetical protein
MESRLMMAAPTWTGSIAPIVWTVSPSACRRLSVSHNLSAISDDVGGLTGTEPTPRETPCKQQLITI